MAGYWQFQTRKGLFRIIPIRGRFHPYFEDEDLGSYYSVEQALDDLVGGHTFFPSDGTDPSECELPEEINEWTFVRT
ncbi:MAG: hypothetical protein K9G60_05655 [Pseudolabrys sp.]|nr:hypothetical protein [Pseudolabrys sp.]